MDLQSFRTWFDTQFINRITNNIQEFNSYSASLDVQAISEYLIPLASHGKRFRPYLVYAALDTERSEDHIDLFVAIELLHVYALIHDDVMDGGSVRHGISCAHKQFSEVYKNQKVGEGLAILLGDLVYQWSYESILNYVSKYPAYKEKILNIYNTLIKEVIHGQMLDVIAPVKDVYSEELIIQKMYLKTARYSFVHPIQLGYAAKGEQMDSFADTYGGALGLMFQIQDDLLDVTQGTGKSSFLDMETSQQTILSWYMYTKADDVYKKEYAGYVGRKLTEEEKEKVCTLLEHSGAYTYAKEQVEVYYQRAIGGYGVTTKWQQIAGMVHNRIS